MNDAPIAPCCFEGATMPAPPAAAAAAAARRLRATKLPVGQSSVKQKTTSPKSSISAGGPARVHRHAVSLV